MAISIAVSACLLGTPCRYDGQARPCSAVLKLTENPNVQLVPICPEVMGGLPTPRAGSEIVRIDRTSCLEADARLRQDDAMGVVQDLRAGRARILTADGQDNTAAFLAGAEAALATCQEHHCTQAILKAKSPSCGSGLVYDGTFSGTLVQGWGATAALLAQHGIRVVDENAI